MIPPRRLALALSLFALIYAAPARAQTAVPTTPLADDPRAADLIGQATRLEQQRTWPDAQKKLDEAKAINPHQPFLWSSYAYIALLRDNKADEAIEDLHRELADHPDEQNVYIALAQTQTKQHKLTDAAATLQKLVALDPANQNSAGLLASALLNDKQYPAAEKTLLDMLAAQPENPQVQTLLATALAREGKKAEAAAILKPLVAKSTDVGILNNAAYVLADENLDPALAEQTVRRALAMIQQGAVNFGGTPALRTEVFVNLWDTLGWALFREGKAAEAEPWIRSAWTNSLAAEPGYHLGMVLEKLNQPIKAMAIYAVAAFGDPGSNPAAVTEGIADRQQALRKAGTPSPVADGKAALQAMLTFKVPGANTLTGTATIEFDISPQGASNAAIVKDVITQDSLTPVEMSLYRIDFKATIPPDAHTALTRRGVLTCHAGAPCQFVLLSTSAALTEANNEAPAAAAVQYAPPAGPKGAARKPDPYYNTPSTNATHGNHTTVHPRHTKN